MLRVWMRDESVDLFWIDLDRNEYIPTSPRPPAPHVTHIGRRRYSTTTMWWRMDSSCLHDVSVYSSVYSSGGWYLDIGGRYDLP